MSVLVVGASVGGVATVSALRQGGFDGPITLVDADETALYDRPPLSKDVLVHGTQLDKIQLVEAQTFDSFDVDLRLGSPAVQLDLEARCVDLVDGVSLGFDHLVIATGSAPRVLPGMRERPGLHLLRTYDDALRLRSDLLESSQLTVIGGGVIGLEVASSARQLGVDVTIVEPLETPMRRVVGPELGPYLSSLLTAAGVNFLSGSAVASLLGDRICNGVQLVSGEEIPSEVTLVSIGTVPMTGWLVGTSLVLEDGVVCDSSCAAIGAEGVFAVGDVCRWNNPRYGRLMRSENWSSAQEQASVVASAILGTPRELDQVPYVWSDQFGRRIQIVGLPSDLDTTTRMFIDETAGEPIAVSLDRTAAVRGVVAVDQPRLIGQARRAMMRNAGHDEFLARLESDYPEVEPKAWTAATQP